MKNADILCSNEGGVGTATVDEPIFAAGVYIIADDLAVRVDPVAYVPLTAERSLTVVYVMVAIEIHPRN
jgi:hypothetical protein